MVTTPKPLDAPELLAIHNHYQPGVGIGSVVLNDFARLVATITDLQSRLVKAEALKDAFVKDWSKAETAEIRAIMRAEKAEKALATLLMIATGFDDDDRDYERINNLAGCENNHWRTQLRLFKEGPTIPTHEGR